MVNAGIAGAVVRAGAELLADVEAWDASASGQGSAQLGTGSNPIIFIGTTTTPNHGSGTSAEVAEWDKDAKDVANGATNGFMIRPYQSGSIPYVIGNTNRIMASDGFYGGSGQYRNGDKVIETGDNLRYGIARGPVQNTDGASLSALNYIHTAMSVSDLSTWHGSHFTSLIAFYVYAAMRNTGSTNSNLEYYWETGIDSAKTSLSGGNSLLASGTLTNPYFQDGTINSAPNQGYTPNVPRNGISSGNAFGLYLGGGRGGIVLPSAGDFMTGWVQGHRNWTAPNPDQLISTDKVYWRHDWL